MKVLTAIALLLAVGSLALAKPTSVDQPSLAFVRNDADTNIGTLGAMRERDYFEAPQTPLKACRLQPGLFNKTRLAQACP